MADDPRVAFLEAATWHGPLEPAESILATHPELARHDIHVAALLGDDEAVRQFLTRDPSHATAKSDPYGANALVYLGLSKYLRLDPARTDGFVRAATALLDAGTDPNSGFWTTGQFPEFETALYGAAGVAHNAPLTRLLLERGADPNDEEVVYHSPEGYDLAAMKLVVETGKLTADSLAVMLIRKHDWHDYRGAKYLLEQGADPNHERRRGWPAIHHAIARDNDLEIIELLLDHGADLQRRVDGLTAIARAARRGRGDLLAALAQRGIAIALDGVDRLIAACASGEASTIGAIAKRGPALVRTLAADGGMVLAEFAGNGNTAGVRHLLDLGVPAAATHGRGDVYWDLTPESTALHVAAWRARHDTVRLLLERGAAVNARDGKGRTPLAMAVKACVDSYWTDMRSPESVHALLEAGASVDGVPFPCGYDAVDALLRR